MLWTALLSEMCSFVGMIIICNDHDQNSNKLSFMLQSRHQIQIESMKAFGNFISFVSFHWLSKSQFLPKKCCYELQHSCCVSLRLRVA